jgi:hypothetical protein
VNGRIFAVDILNIVSKSSGSVAGAKEEEAEGAKAFALDRSRTKAHE